MSIKENGKRKFQLSVVDKVVTVVKDLWYLREKGFNFLIKDVELGNRVLFVKINSNDTDDAGKIDKGYYDVDMWKSAKESELT